MLYSIVRELNPVWHELLHLWRIFLACWFFLGGGGGSTGSKIHSALVFGMYNLWNLWCSMAGSMYQMASPCSTHDALFFGLL